MTHKRTRNYWKGLLFIMLLLPAVLLLSGGCQPVQKIQMPIRRSSTGGTAFFQKVAGWNLAERDSLALKEILNGNFPSFLRRFHPVKVTATDTLTGKKMHAVFFVSPDYLSIGTDKDWVRLPMGPGTAQMIADSFQCFLPTRKMVDDIYKAAVVKPEPIPMFAFRDSAPTFFQHNLIIEGQRKGKKGLIAGIKKDVVISGRIPRDSRPGRVAIYGWHRVNGQPIQPLYTGHAAAWVDYSHGIRLVYRKIKVNGRWMEHTELLQHPVLRQLLCDEEYCDFYKYPY